MCVKLFGCPSPCSCVSSVCYSLNTPFVTILVSSFLDPRVYRDRIIHPHKMEITAACSSSPPPFAAHVSPLVSPLVPSSSSSSPLVLPSASSSPLVLPSSSSLVPPSSSSSPRVPRHPSAPRYPWAC